MHSTSTRQQETQTSPPGSSLIVDFARHSNNTEVVEIPGSRARGALSVCTNAASLSPGKIRRISYTMATTSSPAQATITSAGPGRRCKRRLVGKQSSDIDKYSPPSRPLPLSERSPYISAAAVIDKYGALSALSPCYDDCSPSDNTVKSFINPNSETYLLSPSETNLGVSPGYSDELLPISEQAIVNRMWDVYEEDDVIEDGEFIPEEYYDEEEEYDDENELRAERSNSEQYLPDESSRTPQRKNSYIEATQNVVKPPPAAANSCLDKRLSANVLTSSNHISGSAGNNSASNNPSTSAAIVGDKWYSFGIANDVMNNDAKINRILSAANNDAGTVVKDTVAPIRECAGSIIRGDVGANRAVRRTSSIESSAAAARAASMSTNATRSLIVVSLSFVLVFSSFRSVQSLESSLNTRGGLGVVAMACVHASMCLTCHATPKLVRRLSAKWSMVVGFALYMIWIVGNMVPHPLTLLPTAIGVGVGQSLVWTAQVVYVRTLREQFRLAASTLTSSTSVVPSSPTISRKSSSWMTSTGCRYDALFLAGFQTSHIWGNIISSVLLRDYNPYAGSRYVAQSHVHSADGSEGDDEPSEGDVDLDVKSGDAAADAGGLSEGSPSDVSDGVTGVFCGVYDRCGAGPEAVSLMSLANGTVSLSPNDDVIKLMGSYLVFTFTGFMLILVFLERIDNQSTRKRQNREHLKTPQCLESIWTILRQLVTHRTYRLLVPLLVLNGFEQGFVYADYTKSYVACAVGIDAVGYNMVSFGLANSLCTVLVSWCATRQSVNREALVGVASVLQLGLLVFLLVWIPDRNLGVVFVVVSALWGACDALWQTQCTELVSLTCVQPGNPHDAAFQNFRLLQGLGASLAFAASAAFCVTVRLYVIISLLIIAVILYVAVEYQLRQPDTNSKLASVSASAAAVAVVISAEDVHQTIIN